MFFGLIPSFWAFFVPGLCHDCYYLHKTKSRHHTVSGRRFELVYSKAVCGQKIRQRQTSMISTPCKMFLRQISPPIFLKMSFFSLDVQNPFFRRTLMILKIDTRLGSQIKSLSTHGGTVNSCTALTPSRQKYSNLAVCLSPVSRRVASLCHWLIDTIVLCVMPLSGWG